MDQMTSIRRAPVLTGVVGLVVSALAATAPAKSAMPTGYIYTATNDPQNNAVAVFQRHADGTLAEVAGSPFLTGGRGLTGGDIDQQGPSASTASSCSRSTQAVTASRSSAPHTVCSELRQQLDQRVRHPG
jgi:hypothetical protein